MLMDVRPSRPLRFPPFRLDGDNACLWRGTKAVRLTPKAFAVLQCLAERHGRVVDINALSALAPFPAPPSPRTLDDEVDARPRRERGQPRKQVQRLEDEVARAVLPWALQLEHDAAVLSEPEPILCDRRPQQVSAELLRHRTVGDVVGTRARPLLFGPRF